jgi:hypothetical protein
MNIEDTMCEESLPGNTIAMANRLKEILTENETNNIPSLKDKNAYAFKQFKKCLWLINSQAYGQMATIDMMDEWSSLCGGKTL